MSHDSDDQETDLRESTPGPSGPDDGSGGIGVSSEREGPTGPGQVATDGVRDVSPPERAPDDETTPEQAVGEDNPEGLEPKAGYPSLDPRSKHKPYQAPPRP
jgi:hypothetical protein